MKTEAPPLCEHGKVRYSRDCFPCLRQTAEFHRYVTAIQTSRRDFVMKILLQAVESGVFITQNEALTKAAFAAAETVEHLNSKRLDSDEESTFKLFNQ